MAESRWCFVFPAALQTDRGAADIRIVSNVDQYDWVPNIVHTKPVFLTCGASKSKSADKDLDFFNQQVEFTLRDVETLAFYDTDNDEENIWDFKEGTVKIGTADPVTSTSLDYDWGPNTQFLEWMLSHADWKLYIFLEIPRPDGTMEFIYRGVVDTNNVPTAHTFIAEVDSHEERIQQHTFLANSLAEDLKSKTVADLKALFVETDTKVGPFYAGWAADGYQKWPETTRTIDVSSHSSDPKIIPLAYGYIDPVTGDLGTYPSTQDAANLGAATYPHGYRGIKYVRVIKRLFDALNFEFDEASGIDAQLHYYGQTWSDAHDAYVFRVSNAEVQAQVVVMQFNIAFGYSPLVSLTKFDTPLTWKDTDPLMAVLKAACVQFGCRPDVTFNQSTKRPIGKLVPFSKPGSALPVGTALEFSSSKREPRAVEAGKVRTFYTGDTTSVLTGTKAGSVVDREVRHRVRKFGELTSPALTRETATANKRVELDLQYENASTIIYYWPATRSLSEYTDYDAAVPRGWMLSYPSWGPVKFGWMLGSLLYVERTGNVCYPSWVYPVGTTNNRGAAVKDWDHYDTSYYALSYCDEGQLVAGATTDYGEGDCYTDAVEHRFNVLHSVGQITGRELGAKRVLTRAYIGNCDESGNFLGLGINQTITYEDGGNTLTLRGVETEQGILDPYLSGRFVEYNADDVNTEISWEWKDADDSTAGGSDTGSSSTVGKSTGDYLVRSPGSTADNTITPKDVDVVPLSINQAVGSTSDALSYSLSTGDKVFYVEKSGAWHVALSADTVAGKITMAPGQSSHAIIIEDSSHVTLAGIDAAGAVFAQDVQDFSLTVDGPVKSVGGYLVNDNIDVSSEITGTLPINHGGTNAITASGALNNLTPTQTGHAGEYLSTDGAGNITWQPSSGGSTSSAGNKVYNFKSFQ
jgi:hypothetical protein